MAMRPWQRCPSTANSEGKRKSLSSNAREFVPRCQREKDLAKENVNDISYPSEKNQVEKNIFPWHTKKSVKALDLEDVNDDDSTVFNKSMSIASTDLSPVQSEPDDSHGDVSDAQETEPETFAKVFDTASRHDHLEDNLKQPGESGGQDQLELKVSPTSWMAMRRSQKTSGNTEDEDIVRKMNSILNKLTIEKFSVLSRQLVTCGIKTSVHLELLINEIFEKATTQHHFIDMYADLCVLLQGHFAEHSISNDSNKTLKRILLSACQTSFERHLGMLASVRAFEGDERVAAEQRFKRQMIGNIKLVGGLFVRRMLASKIVFSIVSELLDIGKPEALETLAAFLLVVGPTFDQPDCKHRMGFIGVYKRIEAISTDVKVKMRVRCLLRDVLDLRAVGWQDSKPNKLEKPSKLEKNAEELTRGKHVTWNQHQMKHSHDSRSAKDPRPHLEYCNRSGSAWDRGSTLPPAPPPPLSHDSCSRSEAARDQGSAPPRPAPCSVSGSEWEQGSTPPTPSLPNGSRSVSGSECDRGLTQSEKTKLRDVMHGFQDFCPATSSRSETRMSKQVYANREKMLEEQHEARLSQEKPQECKGQARNTNQFDKAACNKCIVGAFLALMKTQDVTQAVCCIDAAKVPEALQAEQLCDLLSFIVEAGAEAVRTLGFQLIVSIYLQGCWSEESLVKGFESFITSMRAARNVSIPDLKHILCTELVLAFTPLFDRGLLPTTALLRVLEARKDVEFVEDDEPMEHEESSEEDPSKIQEEQCIVDGEQWRTVESEQFYNGSASSTEWVVPTAQCQSEAWWPSAYCAPAVLYYVEPHC